MAKNFIHEGDVLNYTAGANIASGQFVLIGAIGGVAIGAIANGATGAVRVKGVFSVPKASGAVKSSSRSTGPTASRTVAAPACCLVPRSIHTQASPVSRRRRRGSRSSPSSGAVS